jgi:hypothetical protein
VQTKKPINVVMDGMMALGEAPNGTGTRRRVAVFKAQTRLRSPKCADAVF